MKRRGNPEGLKEGADKRAIATHNALVDAYSRLTRGEPIIVKKSAIITPSSVAREAGVDRGVLYGHHRDILEKIHQAKIERKEGFGFHTRRRNKKEAAVRNEELNGIVEILQKEKADLATALQNSRFTIFQLQENFERVTRERDDLKQQLIKIRPLHMVNNNN